MKMFNGAKQFVTVALPVMAAAVALLAGAGPAGAAFPGANGKLAFQSDRDGNDEIYIMNADGSGQTNLTNNGAFDGEPAWSPNGQKIAFESDRDGNSEVLLVGADGSHQGRLTINALFDGEPAWSPDGNKIAFQSNRDGNREIYVMNADGSSQINLTNNPDLDRAPVWSPDGQKIAFFSDRDENLEIYVMNADGTGQTNLTNNAAGDQQPAWSPDGQKIAFQSTRDGNNEVYVMNADGTGQTRLTTNDSDDIRPAWSPDGQKIAFQSTREGNSEIYVVNADGSGALDRLTIGLAFDGDADWQTIPSADLAVGLAAQPVWVKPARPLTYSITVSNSGPSSAAGIVVNDVLPASLRFVSASLSQGSCLSPPPGSNGTVTCHLGSLSASQSESATIEIVVQAIVRKTTVTNTASVASSTDDPNTSNNEASIATLVK
jgi:uncharacterized repeat protein (TIGR01451 family)